MSDFSDFNKAFMEKWLAELAAERKVWEGIRERMENPDPNGGTVRIQSTGPAIEQLRLELYAAYEKIADLEETVSLYLDDIETMGDANDALHDSVQRLESALAEDHYLIEELAREKGWAESSSREAWAEIKSLQRALDKAEADRDAAYEQGVQDAEWVRQYREEA